MKKKKIEKDLKYHKKWLKSILKGTGGKVEIEIKAEIEQLTWILKMFKK
tara:strand:- start:3332 stop:3478 length:147 start_codon:yes stop_codon:yes gene_type:complete